MKKQPLKFEEINSEEVQAILDYGYRGWEDFVEDIVIPETFNNKTVTVVEFNTKNTFPFFAKSIEIPKSVKKIILSDSIFKIKNISISIDNPYYCIEDKILYNKNKTELILNLNKNIEKVIIPKGVKIIKDHSFSNCRKLKSIEIPSTVEIIEDVAFATCEKLTSINIYSYSIKIASSAFDCCSKINEVKFPEQLEIDVAEIFGDTEFYKTKMTDEEKKFFSKQSRNNRKYIIPEGITVIPSKYFCKFKKVKEIILPNTITEIGKEAFSNEFIENIDLPSSLKIIKNRAFSNCKLLKKLYIPQYVEKIDVPICPHNNRTQINNDACFEEIEVDKKNNNFTTINGVLYSKNLDTLYEVPPNYKYKVFEIPKEVKNIKRFACKYNKNIEKIIFNSEIENMGKECFGRCNNLKEVVFFKNQKKIGNGAFSYCSKLEKIIWSKNIEIIEERAFENCALEELKLPDTVIQIEEKAFDDNNIHSLELPKSLIEIGSMAFRNNKLKSVVVPKSVNKIGNAIFATSYDKYKEKSMPDEVIIYDSIEDDIERINVKIFPALYEYWNSNIGRIALPDIVYGSYGEDLEKWDEYIIKVYSAETDKLKYRILMPSSDYKDEYKKIAKLWGKNAIFNFEEADNLFKEMGKHKFFYAFERLLNKNQLEDDTIKIYSNYLLAHKNQFIDFCVKHNFNEDIKLFNELEKNYKTKSDDLTEKEIKEINKIFNIEKTSIIPLYEYPCVNGCFSEFYFRGLYKDIHKIFEDYPEEASELKKINEIIYEVSIQPNYIDSNVNINNIIEEHPYTKAVGFFIKGEKVYEVYSESGYAYITSKIMEGYFLDEFNWFHENSVFDEIKYQGIEIHTNKKFHVHHIFRHKKEWNNNDYVFKIGDELVQIQEK